MAKSMVLIVLLAGLLACLQGCSSSQYRYVPSQQSQAAREGGRRGTAVYAVPSSLPQGQVRIFSSGIVTLKSENNSKSFKALHVRMIFSNQSKDQTWTVDSANQVVAFPNQGQSQPVFVNSDANSQPDLQVRPGELRLWDLYFPLPAQQQEAKDLPAFDFHWSFQAGSSAVAETTPFERAPIRERAVVVYPDGPYPYYLGFGWGGYWWGGPYGGYWARR